jgi:hypothetical protein
LVEVLYVGTKIKTHDFRKLSSRKWSVRTSPNPVFSSKLPSSKSLKNNSTISSG